MNSSTFPFVIRDLGLCLDSLSFHTHGALYAPSHTNCLDEELPGSTPASPLGNYSPSTLNFLRFCSTHLSQRQILSVPTRKDKARFSFVQASEHHCRRATARAAWKDTSKQTERKYLLQSFGIQAPNMLPLYAEQLFMHHDKGFFILQGAHRLAEYNRRGDYYRSTSHRGTSFITIRANVRILATMLDQVYPHLLIQGSPTVTVQTALGLASLIMQELHPHEKKLSESSEGANFDTHSDPMTWGSREKRFIPGPIHRNNPYQPTFFVRYISAEKPEHLPVTSDGVINSALFLSEPSVEITHFAQYNNAGHEPFAGVVRNLTASANRVLYGPHFPLNLNGSLGP